MGNIICLLRLYLFYYSLRNTPAQSRQFERCNLTEDSSEKISPFPPQAKNPGPILYIMGAFG